MARWPRTDQSERPLTALPALTIVVFLSAFLVALGQTGAAGQSSRAAVDVGALPVGTVKAVTLTIHALGDERRPVSSSPTRRIM